MTKQYSESLFFLAKLSRERQEAVERIILEHDATLEEHDATLEAACAAVLETNTKIRERLKELGETSIVLRYTPGSVLVVSLYPAPCVELKLLY